MTDWYEELFTCVICERAVRDWSGRSARDKHLSPTCKYCEQTWGAKVAGGAFMDRRIAAQIHLLAGALNATAWHAYHKEFGYGPKRL
jgi:hypothetical protein